jgi:hypothetical protein
MNRTHIAVLAAVAALPLSLGACSSSTAGSGSTAAGAHKPGSASVAAPTSAAPASVAPASVAPASAAAGGGDACTFLAKSNQVLLDIGAGDSAPGGVDKQKIKHDLQVAADQAPAEIKGDVQTIVQFDISVIDGDTTVKETPALQTAMQHYASWIAAHCAGISNLPTGSTS